LGLVLQTGAHHDSDCHLLKKGKVYKAEVWAQGSSTYCHPDDGSQDRCLIIWSDPYYSDSAIYAVTNVYPKPKSIQELQDLGKLYPR